MTDSQLEIMTQFRFTKDGRPFVPIDVSVAKRHAMDTYDANKQYQVTVIGNCDEQIEAILVKKKVGSIRHLLIHCDCF
jgi:hypothetical protein